MKLNSVIMSIVCLLTGSLNLAYAFGSGTKAAGDILFNNGKRLEGVTFEMPCEMDKQIWVFLDGEKQKVDTDSIDYIVLWQNKYPDEKHLIKPFKIELVDIETGEITGQTDYRIWLCCDYMGENASYWVKIGRPSFKKGNLRFNFNSRATGKSMYYVLKKGHETPAHRPDNTKNVKKWVKVYFNDDPEVMRKFEAGEYDGSDWGYKYVDIRKIIDDYAPRK